MMSVKAEKVEVRVSPAAKKLLKEAAKVRHKSMSEFVLDSALAQAEETLLNRRILQLSADERETFMAALDTPPSRHPRMEKLLKTSSVFD
ncbi:MAG: DUF1778 domain-containing protein [Pseudomonadota bacterium]